MKGADTLFSHAKDTWATPVAFFDNWKARRGGYDLDAAADASNHLCDWWYGPGSPIGDDALLIESWGVGQKIWLNPPYSRSKEFIKKAHSEAFTHCNLVDMLLPARTDTKAFHTFIYDAEAGRFHLGVYVWFIKGRLKFGGSTNSAPFPSMLVTFNGLLTGK